MVNNSFTSNSLIILLWNYNGILNHVNELIAVLHEKRIDIALISESHLTERSKLNIPGYHLITSHHPDGTSHAGFAILIRTFIHFNSLPNTTEDYLQACAISINLNHIPITISAAYCPPRHNKKHSSSNNFSLRLVTTSLLVEILMRKILIGVVERATPVEITYYSSSLPNNTKFILLHFQLTGPHPQTNVQI